MKSVFLNLSLVFVAQSAMAINPNCSDPAKCTEFPGRGYQIVSAPVTVEEATVTLNSNPEDTAFYLAFGELLQDKMFPNGAPLLKKNEKVSETDWDGTKINSYLNCGDINGKFYCDVGVGSNVVYSQSAPNAYSAYLHLQGNLTNDSYANGFIEILSKGSEKGYRVESFKDDTGTKFWLKSGVVGGKGPDSIECLMTEDSRKSYCKLFIWSDVYDVFTATSL